MSSIVPRGGWTIHAPKFPVLLGFEYEIDTSIHDDVDVSDGDETPFNEQTMKAGCPHYVWHFEGLGDNNGWEIKSHVAPLHLHRAGLRHFLANAWFNELRSGHDNDGGIHINISRNEFTEKQHNLVFSFLHDTANYEWLKKLSGRAKSKLDYFAMQHGKTGWTENAYSWGDKQKKGDLYFSIISSRKTHAFEIRMFAAHPKLLVPAMEFGDALFHLAPQVTGEITIDNFTAFVNRKMKYANLAALIKEKFA